MSDQKEFVTDCLVSSHDDRSTNKLVKAIWDTGATDTVISEHLAMELELMAIDRGLPYQVVGKEAKKGNRYMIRLRFPDIMSTNTPTKVLANPWEIPVVSVDIDDLGDDELILGMDIIKKGTLIISEGKTFCFTSPAVAKNSRQYMNLFSQKICE